MFRVTLIACGNKMPDWVYEAVNEYAKRLQEFVNLSVIEIPLGKRTKSSDLARIMDKESLLMNKAIPNGAYVVALEIHGLSFSSEKLAEKLALLQQSTSHLCFIVGGPEGLAPATLRHCHEQWSLSKLTLPHPLVRVILMETLYRACSININHPYHK